MKVGVIGCGMIAELGHIPAIQHTEGFDLYALSDINWERTLELQKNLHVPHAYKTAEEFFASDIDLAVICSPVGIHYQHVMMGIKNRKPMLCEKPLAATVEEIKGIVDTAEQNKHLVFPGFVYRFSSCARQVKSLLQEGAIGEPRALRLIYLWNCHGRNTRDDQGRMRRNEYRHQRMLEGGPLPDCGVHQIDLARWWLDSEVVWQECQGVWVEDYEAPDHVYLHLGHQCGTHTMVELSFSYHSTSLEPQSNFKYEIIGTDGTIFYDRNHHMFELRNSKGTFWLPWSHEKDFTTMYYDLAKTLNGSYVGGLPTPFDALRCTQIADDGLNEAISHRARYSNKHGTQDKNAHVESLEAADVPLDHEEVADLVDRPLEIPPSPSSKAKPTISGPPDM